MIYLQGKNRPIGIKEEDINDENYLLIKNILKDEHVHVHSWIEVSLVYYKKNHYKLFLDLTKEGEIFYLTKDAGRGVEKEPDERDTSKDGSNFYTLLLLYHLEKIMNVKNVSKEDELKIKLENLINQIERRRSDVLLKGVEVDMPNGIPGGVSIGVSIDGSNKPQRSIPWETYDYLSPHLPKAIYNVNMYLYLLNKYDRKSGANYFQQPRTSPLDGEDEDDEKKDASEEKIKNEYINPLNYLMESISILTDLVKKNKYDFVASIYLSLSLCLTYKLDLCIEFSSHVLIRVLNLQNFLNDIVSTYRGVLNPVGKESPSMEKGATTWLSKFISSAKGPNESTDKRGDKDSPFGGREHTAREEHLYKCIRLNNLLTTLRRLKGIIKYIIGICYVKKKEWSTASFCLTEAIKMDGQPQAYLTNGWLLLMNYLGKIADCNDFVREGIHWEVRSGGLVHIKEEESPHLESLPDGWDKNDLRKIPIRDVINLTLLRYYDYLRGGIVKYSKGVETFLMRESSSSYSYHIDKNDIYEYDEAIEMTNSEGVYLKKNHEHVHLSERMIYLYLDLCEIWLMQGNTKSVSLLKLMKDKIHFNYVDKKCLSKYYFLIGMYYHHIVRNIRRALKYYHKSLQIYGNHVSRYYHTICLLYLRRYTKAKKNILFFFQKCKNAYFVKLYVFFFLHTANLFLNFNLLCEGSSEALPHGGPTVGGEAVSHSIRSTTQSTTRGEETKQGNDNAAHVSVRSKYMKSTPNDSCKKIVLKMLQHLMDVLEAHHYMFHIDLDIKLMRVKIRELLLTKYNQDEMVAYNKELSEMEPVRTFFRQRNKPRKISYELINNYVISLFFCDQKERSVELMELLKREVFLKVKRFSSYYSYAFCGKPPDPRLSRGREEHKFGRSMAGALSSTGNIARKRSAASPGCTKKKSKRGGIGSPCEEVTTEIAPCEEVITETAPREEASTWEAKQKRGDLLRLTLRRNKLKLCHMHAMLRHHRIREAKLAMVSHGAKLPHHVYIKRSNRKRYREIINYLKRIYITISFNSAVLAEYLGYKDPPMQTYKLYTKLYKTYEGAFVRLANVYIKMKKFSKAKEVIEKGLQTNPKSVNLLLQKVYLHVERKNYDYCIYTLEKLKKSEDLQDDVLINTYLAIIKFFNLKRGKNKEEKNQLVNEIYSHISLLGRSRNNFFVSSLISILLSVNHKVDLSSEAFQFLIDSNEKLTFYYKSALRNFVLHMFNHLMRTNHVMNNKLFLKKLNLFFNLSLKNGINDKPFLLCYANFLHLIEKFEDAIVLLYSAYVKWPHDLSILNTLIICIDSFVSKYLSSDYVELTDILLMGDLIAFSFCAIHTLLRFKRLATSAELLASDERHNYYKEGDLIIEVRRKDIEHLASRKYLISTYRKFEEKIKPYIESSVPSMVRQKKMYNQKKINLQRKIYEEKKKKKNMEMKKLKSQESLHEELLRDVSELTYHMTQRETGMLTLGGEEKDAAQEEEGEVHPRLDHPEEEQIEKDDEKEQEEKKQKKEPAKENNPGKGSNSDGDPQYVETSSSSSDLFEEKKPKKRKKVID
ncbi:hypothetical protein C922_01652 [Plasmodium inui San Antonio 1]|uniref:Tetratricopeptide repeat protein n=1 Tax=Plasmodium inui San Antonio 1 TaxID=1237626 RepID=W7A8Q3_9APIC|nr:hypothetical protein C922_01652 [Plasmodium inui San Antonio 1]EUD68040.1 hypothetical protein C922_01652 [Plasmodium inui San Antonio 1]